jgi:DNA invertase Pin-like site-specific DNA recombinase
LAQQAVDLTTPSGRALAGMLAEFERDILRDRVRGESIKPERISTPPRP